MLYADARRAELAAFNWSREQEDAFFKMQFELQSRAYRMQFPEAVQFIVELEGRTVGRIIVERGEREIKLIDISLLAEFRNRGIGSAFLRHCVALAHERGCGRMEWTCLDWNTRAQRVYQEKLGAQRMSEWYLYRLTRPAMEEYLHGSDES